MSVVTPLKTAAEQALSAQFASAKGELPGALPVRKLREDAFAGFEARGLPHRRLETWRYTDLRSLLREARPLADTAAVTDGVRARLAALALDGIRLVLVDGVFVPELSTLEDLPEGLIVHSLADALVAGRDDIARVLSGPGVADADSGLMLNTALMRDGVFIEIAAGTITENDKAMIGYVSLF